jgi:hypothetical protein
MLSPEWKEALSTLRKELKRTPTVGEEGTRPSVRCKRSSFAPYPRPTFAICSSSQPK